MRDFINLVTLCEGVSVHPSEMVRRDGETYIEFPKAGTSEIEKPCEDCEYHDGQIDPNCSFCHGSGKEKEIIYNFPSLDVSYGNLPVIADLLGATDAEDETHWIPNEHLPNIMRHLIKMKNGNAADIHASDTSVSGGEAYVDTTDAIPTIRKRAQIVNVGRSPAQVQHYIDRLIEIVRYAQLHGIGVSWS